MTVDDAPKEAADETCCIPNSDPVGFPNKEPEVVVVAACDTCPVVADGVDDVAATVALAALSLDSVNNPELPNAGVVVLVAAAAALDVAEELVAPPKRLRAAVPEELDPLGWAADVELAPVGKVTPLRMFFVDCWSLAFSSVGVTPCDRPRVDTGLSSMDPRSPDDPEGLNPGPASLAIAADICPRGVDGLSNKDPRLEEPHPKEGLELVPASSAAFAWVTTGGFPLSPVPNTCYFMKRETRNDVHYCQALQNVRIIHRRV